MEQLQQLRNWYQSLPTKEQWMVTATGILLATTLFYLAVWEPIQLDLKEERVRQQDQQKILSWMQSAASEVQQLRATGSSGKIRDKNKPVTLVIEQALKNAGLKTSVSKIESSGKDGARVVLSNTSFNQMLIWLNTLARHNGIQVVSANVERGSSNGQVDARLTFERP